MIASLITALYLLNVIPPDAAYEFLYVCGILLIVSEVAVGGHGLIALNGLFAILIARAIQMGTNELFGIHIDWSVLFGLAAVETVILFVSVGVFLHYRKLKAITGKESMVGQKARIVSWHGTKGKAFIHGETWNVESPSARELKKGDEVAVSGVDGLTLKI